MKKEEYERTKLEIIRFQSADVIMASNLYEEDELPFAPNH